jgi:hypothetical protein
MDGWLVACLVAGFVVGELQEVLDGPSGRRQERRRRHLLRLRGLTGRRLGGSRGLGAAPGRRGNVGAGAGAADGAEADADAGGEVALVVPRERAGDVDGLVAVAAEERPVLDAEDEGRLLLADVAARDVPGGPAEREALVLAGELVGGVDLDVAARAQRRLVRAAHHRGRRALARVALDPHARPPSRSSRSSQASRNPGLQLDTRQLVKISTEAS